MLCYAMLCYAMLCYAMLCYAMLCYAMLCHVMLCYVMLCYVMLCCVMLCYVMLSHVFRRIQMDSAKALKALMSGDHRRQSITASKKRRPSVYLERRGSIRRDSKLPLLGSINKELEAESVTEQKADDAFVTDQQNSADMIEQEAATALVSFLLSHFRPFFKIRL